MKLLRYFLVFCLATMVGCSTIYFHRDGGLVTNLDYGEWHHDGILRLVEFSSPVDLKDRCGGKDWKTVRVEETFLNGLARGVTYGLYDPWDVSYACK